MDIANVLLKTTDLVLKITGSSTFKEFVASIRDYEKETKMLAETIHFIGDVLSDVEGLPFQGKSSEINAYNRLRIAYLDAEDFLDAIQTTRKQLEAEDKMIKQAKEEIVHKANEKGTGCGSLALAPFTIKSIAKKTCRSFSFRKFTKAHHEIKEIRRKLDAISNDLQSFGLTKKDNNMESVCRRDRVTGAFVNATSIIGREGDKRKIIDLLLGACTDDGQIPVISIVGIGGMGKTTVAQLVYDDKRRLESCKFDLKLWVSDSKQFDLKLLLQKVLKAICPKDNNLLNLELDLLQNLLRMEISGKKYLLVLDDVENESRRDWIQLEELLKLGAEGSRILVTTRSRRVAKVMSSDSMVHELKGLSEEDSWLLFEKMAFRGSKDEKLVQIGRDIVQKCGGVPLAIKTIGCLLYGQADNKWKRVRNRHVANIEGDDSKGIIPILRESYDALDRKAKECFRYCALFPQSHLISKRMLINICMSNVSIETNTGEQTEDVWEDIIWTLYNRCFLEKMENLNDDDDEYFEMHDLMNDLAREVAGAEMFVVGSDVALDSGTLTLEENIRHIGLMSEVQTIERISRIEPKGRRIRTLLCHHFYWYHSNPWEKLFSVHKLKSNYPVLRMLDLEKANIDRLPDSVGELIHLRFLNLSQNPLNILPDSIAKLWNLQTLSLQWCDKLEKLPQGLRKLINLRYLDLKRCRALTYLPSGMGDLKLLCKLNMFIVGDSESEHTAKLEDLEPLSNLQGKLTIKLPIEDNLREDSGSCRAILLNKKELWRLKIEWPESRYDEAGEDLGNGDMDIMAKLQPHSDLEVLKVYNYEGLRFPPWEDALGSLSLVTLEIIGSMRCQHLPSFSKLPCLKSFTVYHLLSLEYMEENVPAAGALFFPSLQHFKLHNLPELKGWCRKLTGAEEQFFLLPSFPHHLAKMTIKRCPNLKMASMPSSPTLRQFFLGHNMVSFTDVKEPCISVEEDLSSRWNKFPPEENDSVVSTLVSVPVGQFWADNLQLLLSTPWEQFLHVDPPNLSIKDLNVFNVEEASFRRMSDWVTSLEIINIPELKTFPKALRHLTALRELYIANCEDFIGEEYEEPNHSTSKETIWKGFESLRRLSLKRLSKLVRLPKEVFSLTSLQVLDIQICEELEVFPTDVSELINLKYLRLSQCNYLGVESLYRGSDMSNLAFLEIERDRLESPPLQSLCQYQWLKHLKLSHIRTLEYIQDDNSAAFSFPSLESIWLHYLPYLRDWCKGLSSNNVNCSEKEQSLRQLFPRLSRLDIQECRNFNENSILLSSVRVFIFGYCTSACHKSFSSFGSLYCALMTSEDSIYKTVLLEQYHRGNLLPVVIYNEEFELVWRELNLERVSSRITALHLEESTVVKTLPQELNHLTALQSLTIVGYSQYFAWEEDEEDTQSEVDTSWGGLKSLTHLEFRDLPKMTTLPEWIRYIPSLQEVKICGCDSLVVPDWVHIDFHKVLLPEQQGFQFIRKSIDGSFVNLIKSRRTSKE